jgi:hypothetical protein
MRLVLPAAAALALTAFAAITLWRDEDSPSVMEPDMRRSTDEAMIPREEAPASLKASLKAS